MDIIAIATLLLALALPWLLGYQLLTLVPTAPTALGRLPRAGYGFFLGMALLSLLIRLNDWLGEGVSFAMVSASLVALLLLVLLAKRFLARNPAHAEVAPSVAPMGRGWSRWFQWVLAAGILVHWLFSLVEIITLPLFPWDGWTIWAYRAKAWFMAGELAPMVSLANWLGIESAQVYNVQAKSYPLLPSLMHLWAALGLGRWHEALINLPVMGAALGICAALAGSLKALAPDSPQPWLIPLLAVYLLISTPIFGVHMSLGGYADIWMAGFAGVGMIAVIAGLLQRQVPLLVLGMLLLSLSLLVKIDGLLWLLLAVALIMLVRLPVRLILLVLGAAVLLGLLAWLTGNTMIAIPGLGKVGYQPGFIRLPFKGLIRLQIFDVSEAYWRNAFVLGSWHLVWMMAVAAVMAVLIKPAGRLTRVLLVFFLLFVSLQGIIFVFTSEGAWAEDYTAINRLPMQMLPAVIYLLGAAVVQLLRERGEAIAKVLRQRRTWAAALAGVGVMLLVAGVWLTRQAAEPALPERQLGSDTLRFVLGQGEISAGQVTVTGFQDGVALMTSGPVTLQAQDYSILQVDLSGHEDITDPSQAPAFFWRKANQVNSVSRITLQRDGVLDLTESADWNGPIVEVGFLFIANDEVPMILHSASLQGESLGASLQLLPGEWTSFEPWGQRSANWVEGGAPDQRLPLTALMIAMVLGTSVIMWLLLQRREYLGLLLVLSIAGWMLLDLRWGWDRLRQFQASVQQLQTMTVEERIGASELGKYYPFLQRVLHDHLGPEPQKVLLIRDPFEPKYFGARSKYELLPHSVGLLSGVPKPNRMMSIDYVLFLGDFVRGNRVIPDDETVMQRWRRLGIDHPGTRRRLELVSEGPEGVLFRVVQNPFRNRRKAAQSSPGTQ